MKELTESMKILLSEPYTQFIEINKEYLKSIGEEFYMDKNTIDKNGKTLIQNINPLECPMHKWHLFNNTKQPQEFVSQTAICPLCNQPMCPVCKNHNVHQLSRVTGYMSDVDNWNEAKQQEFKDRTRYNVK